MSSYTVAVPQADGETKEISVDTNADLVDVLASLKQDDEVADFEAVTVTLVEAGTSTGGDTQDPAKDAGNDNEGGKDAA